MAVQGARNPKAGIAPGMSDQAVRAKTGKTWDEWFHILDQAGAPEMGHRGMAAWLDEHYKVGDWWTQMVVVAYEQARGLRDKHQKPSGYEISVRKTIAAPVAAAFKAWSGARTRARWLQDPGFQVRKATANKSMRITWHDGSSLEARFYAKGGGKCQVVAQHGKLANARAAQRMKTYWAGQLESLKTLLET